MQPCNVGGDLGRRLAVLKTERCASVLSHGFVLLSIASDPKQHGYRLEVNGFHMIHQVPDCSACVFGTAFC